MGCRLGQHVQGPSVGRSRSLTQEDEDAGQDGDERAAAEAHGEHVGLGAAGQHVALVVAAAHLDGQRACAAEHRPPAVRDEDGQVEDTLVLLPEAGPPGQNPGGVIWSRQGFRDRKGKREKQKGMERKNHRELISWIGESKGQEPGGEGREGTAFLAGGPLQPLRFVRVSNWVQKPRFLLASRQNPEAWEKPFLRVCLPLHDIECPGRTVRPQI